MEVIVSVVVNFGSDPVPEAVLELVISNSYDASVCTATRLRSTRNFQPNITLSGVDRSAKPVAGGHRTYRRQSRSTRGRCRRGPVGRCAHRAGE
jgi:hypothetical protein